MIGSNRTIRQREGEELSDPILETDVGDAGEARGLVVVAEDLDLDDAPIDDRSWEQFNGRVERARDGKHEHVRVEAGDPSGGGSSQDGSSGGGGNESSAGDQQQQSEAVEQVVSSDVDHSDLEALFRSIAQAVRHREVNARWIQQLTFGRGRIRLMAEPDQLTIEAMVRAPPSAAPLCYLPRTKKPGLAISVAGALDDGDPSELEVTVTADDGRPVRPDVKHQLLADLLWAAAQELDVTG